VAVYLNSVDPAKTIIYILVLPEATFILKIHFPAPVIQ
jgi:hypothetical protein